MKQERSIRAGGCFWGMHDLIRRRDGVISTRVGYSGGDVPDATYHHHGTHVEAIEIVFDPERLGFRELLEFFFQVHDPTTLNRQGNDVGTSYLSAIFTTRDEQRCIAEDTIADVNTSGLWPGRVREPVHAVVCFPTWSRIRDLRISDPVVDKPFAQSLRERIEGD
jgi:peptide-methionine (S)-S-oxide reductase